MANLPNEQESESAAAAGAFNFFDIVDVLLSHRKTAAIAGAAAALLLAAAMALTTPDAKIEAVIRLGDYPAATPGSVIEAARSAYLRQVANQNAHLAAMSARERERYIRAIKLQNPRGTNIIAIQASGSGRRAEILLSYMDELTRAIFTDLNRLDQTQRAEIISKIAIEVADASALTARIEELKLDELNAHQSLTDAERHLQSFTTTLAKIPAGNSTEAKLAYYLVASEIHQWEITTRDLQSNIAKIASKRLELEGDNGKTIARQAHAQARLDNFYPTSVISPAAIHFVPQMSWIFILATSAAFGILAALAAVVFLEARKHYREHLSWQTSINGG